MMLFSKRIKGTIDAHAGLGLARSLCGHRITLCLADRSKGADVHNSSVQRTSANACFDCNLANPASENSIRPVDCQLVAKSVGARADTDAAAQVRVTYQPLF